MGRPWFCYDRSCCIQLTFVISSDCSSGPKEFIGNDSGILFKNGDIQSLEQKILEFLSLNESVIIQKKINAKKKSN